MRESFEKYLKYEKRYSPHTLLSYNNDLNQLESFLEEIYDGLSLNEANHSCLRSWIISLVENSLEPKSINRKIASLRAYYKYLLKQGHITKDPTTKLRPLKVSKRLPQFVSENHIQMLLDHSDLGGDFSGLRDKLIIELLYGTGIRLSELINLQIADVNLNSNTIKVLGKRNKERVIPFSKALEMALQKYLSIRKKQYSTQSDSYLVITDNGEQCYPMFVYRLINRCLTNYTTIEKRSPHVLRHTFATHLLNKGAELNAVKDLLGHSSLAATQVYTHNSLEKLKSVFDQAHPKA